MKEYIKKLLNYWEAKKQQKEEIDLFLKTHHLKLIKVKDTSITLCCIKPVLSDKKGKYNLVTEDGIVLDTNLSQSEAAKRIKEYSNAAKKKKVSFQEHLDELIKRRSDLLKSNRMTEMTNTFVDINGSGKYAPHEIESFSDLEIKFDMTVRASLANEAGDIIAVNGQLINQSLDPLGLRDRAINAWRKNFNKLWDEKRQFANSIDRHFEKIHMPTVGKPPLNKVVIDFRHMDDVGNDMKQKVIDYIYNGLEVNGQKFPSQYSRYVNDEYLIKLNF